MSEKTTMSESFTPLLVALNERDTLPGLIVRNAEEAPDQVGYAIRTDAGWRDVTHAQFLAEVETLAKGFIASGLRGGDRVALMSRTRYEWTLVDFALLSAGVIVVPIYETSSREQVAWIMQDSGAVGAVVEDQEMASIINAVREECPELRDVWHIDAGHLEELAQGAREVTDAQLAARRDSLSGHTQATIIYTSGTTGRPKGCVLTHGNFTALSQNALARMHELVDGNDNHGTLLFLPLAHVFARLIQYVAICARVRLGHTKIDTLVGDLGTYNPSFLLAVPRVFEKVYNTAEQGAIADGKGKIFAQASQVAIAVSERRNAGDKVPLSLAVRHRVFDLLVYRRLRQAFGGKLRYSISGGAPLSKRLAHFYAGVGLPVLEGYGLTETTAPACVNPPEHIKIGTVGPAVPGVGLKIAEDGEILVRGINIFAEYLNNPEASADAMDGDWFKTGDLGALDDEGYLTITGRKKDLIITAGGKNVSPAKLEDALRTHPLIAEAVVVGDARPFIACLISLDEEMLPIWAKAHGLEGLEISDASKNPVIYQALVDAVATANQGVSRAESIRKFVVIPTSLTEESGHLTPSLKVKRNVVLKDYAETIDALYSPGQN